MPDDIPADDKPTTDDKPVEDKPADDAPPEGDKPEDKPADKKPELSLEDAMAEVTKTRAEAANYRTRARDAEKALAEAKTLEEVEQIIQKMTVERESAERDLLAENVALVHKLPPALAARLQGNTREELEADAKALSEFFAAKEEEEDERPVRRPRGGLDPSSDDETDGASPGELARKIPRH